MKQYLKEEGLEVNKNKLASRWGQCALETGEMIRSLLMEKETKLERIVVEDGEEEDGTDIKAGKSCAHCFVKVRETRARVIKC